MSTHSGAESAYRGYWWQFLYTLHRLLLTREEGLIFHPEGNEDLAIYDKRYQLVEAIQVKDYSDNLTISDFFKKDKKDEKEDEEDKKNSFFHRTIKNFKKYPHTKIKIVSFGPIGPEMYKAWQGEEKDQINIGNKLKKRGLLKDDIQLLIEKIHTKKFVLEAVEKDILKQEIENVLNEIATGFDPKNTFDLLIYWIFLASKETQKISYHELRKKIDHIGKYLKERETHHKEWFISIVPLDEIPQQESPHKQLQEEFYQGIAVRYEHILADIDIKRPGKLQAIDDAFQKSNIVVVHGASGQGKSTLAYRYAHDFFPEKWQFAIRLIENRQHSLTIARALIGHVNAVHVPMLIYLDVKPRETHWLDFVREIAPHQKIHLLITIREEDWRRASLSGAEIPFESIELTLEKSEAETLYPRLPKTSQFLAFDEAWQHFQSERPLLLEFVYFVTQNQKLSNRLKEQVERLQSEIDDRDKLYQNEYELLRLVSVASEYGARLDLRELSKALQLIRSKYTVRLFEKEFLLRCSQDGRYVEGLHPVRSAILTSLLTDDENPWDEAASKIVPLMPEEDIENFLLYAFSRHPEAIPSLLETLSRFQPTTWTGLGGIFRTLLWLGLRQYIDENKTLIKELYERFGNGWWMYLKFDITEVIKSADDTLYQFAHLASSSKQQAFIEEINQARNRQTPKERVFVPMKEWALRLNQQPSSPSTLLDWLGLADVYFWLGYLNITAPVLTWITETEIEKGLLEPKLLTLNNLVEVILALSFAWRSRFEKWFKPHQAMLLKRFQEDTQSLLIEDDGSMVKAHFIVALSKAAEKLKTNDDHDELHEKALERIYLLRKLLPHREIYACQGYGHRIGSLPLPIDSTTKKVKSRDLPPPPAVNLNGLFRRLGTYELRPLDWSAYVQSLFSFRKSIVERFKELQLALQVYFKNKKFINILQPEYMNTSEYDRCREFLKTHLFFPKSAVDEWGWTEEHQKDHQQQDLENPQFHERTNYALALQRYEQYVSLTRKFSSHLSNFLTQAIQVIPLNINLGRVVKSLEQKNRVLEKAEELGIELHLRHVSVANFVEALKILDKFQEEFRRHFFHLVDIHQLEFLEKQEQAVFLNLWGIWFSFADHPEWVIPDIKQHAHKKLTHALEQVRKKLRKQFHRLANQDIVVKILSETLEWNAQPSLWLSYDIPDPAILYKSFDLIVERLKKVFGHLEKVQQFAVDIYWQNVIIIPLIKNKSLEKQAYQCSTKVLIYGSTFEDNNWWNFILKPLSLPQWEALKLSLWENPQLDLMIQFREAVEEFFVVIAHCDDFNNLPKFDEIGNNLFQKHLIQKYLTEQAENISSACQKTIDLGKHLVDYSNKLAAEETKQRPNLLMARKLLIDIMLGEDFLLLLEKKEVDLDMNGIKAWTLRLQSVIEQTRSIYLFWVADVIQQETENNH